MSINNDSLVKFGQTVKTHRNDQGFSRVKFAKMCGIHPHTLGLVENGKSNISFLKIIAVSKALNLNPDELVEGI